MLLYDDTATKALHAAADEARHSGTDGYETPHVLLGLLRTADPVTRTVTADHPQLTENAVRTALGASSRQPPHDRGPAAPSRRSTREPAAEFRQAARRFTAKWRPLVRDRQLAPGRKLGTGELWLTVLEGGLSRPASCPPSGPSRRGSARWCWRRWFRTARRCPSGRPTCPPGPSGGCVTACSAQVGGRDRYNRRAHGGGAGSGASNRPERPDPGVVTIDGCAYAGLHGRSASSARCSTHARCTAAAPPRTICRRSPPGTASRGAGSPRFLITC